MSQRKDFGFDSKRNGESLEVLEQKIDVFYQNESGCCVENRLKSGCAHLNSLKASRNFVIVIKYYTY